VLHVYGDDPRCRAFGLGWGHAHDRSLQMEVLRIVGRGEAAERLRGSELLIEQDRYLRQRRIRTGARRDAAGLSGEALAIAEAYCAGVNARRTGRPRRTALLLLGVPREDWSPEDVLLILRTMAWTSLAQAQELVERFIVRSVLQGDDGDLATLRAVFAPHLDGLDPALLRGEGGNPAVHQVDAPLELDPVCARCVPTFGGSNAWALGPDRTASGAALLANDPHLDGQNLPPVFYEVSSAGPDGSAVGISVPGIPGVLAGRFSHVAVGVTYSLLDQVDFFVEECRDGRVLRPEGWVEAQHRTEQIRIRGRAEAVPVELWWSDRGVIEGDPRQAGRYLCRAWVADEASLASALTVTPRLERAADRDEALDALAAMPLPFNFVVADDQGRIGLQQSGLAPRRAPGISGLAPLPAWVAETAWQGLLDPSELTRRIDPTGGFLATANEAVNPTGGPVLVNAALPDYRVRRIRELLVGSRRASPQHMVAIQGDLTSLRAKAWLATLAPLLPDTERGRALAGWDGVYRDDSPLPTDFERLWASCMLAAWGDLFDRASPTRDDDPSSAFVDGLDLPTDAARLWAESNLVAVQTAGFDRVLLDPTSPLWTGRDREGLLRRVAAEALELPARPYSVARRARRTWLLLEGSSLSRLGLGSRMVAIPGSQATPFQGRIVRAMGRVLALGPVWRMVADLSEDRVRTALAGGPSDRPLSRWHRSDLGRFSRLELKELRPPTPPGA
jgi:penicillin G amidase